MSDTAGKRVWRRASRCEAAACVEVAVGDDHVHVRNSAGSDAALSFTVGEWQIFIDGAKAGEFDPVGEDPLSTDVR